MTPLVDISLVESRGLGVAGLLALRAVAREAAPLFDAGPARIREALGALLGAPAFRPRRPVQWPGRAAAENEAAHLAALGARVVWRGEPGYPAKLSERLEGGAPPWVFVCGPVERLSRPACAVIGSRETSGPWLSAARELSRALSRGGTCVVSGLAPGADAAAHAGAMEAPAGTLALPARGLLRLSRAEWAAAAEGRMTLLALGRPLETFNAGLALRRNDAVAALAEGLVLAASGAKGGSLYAVRWAIRHGLPLWAFRAPRGTPPANAALIRSGAARPLDLRASPAEWAVEIRSGMRAPATGPGGAAGKQLDWLEEAAAA